MLKRFKDNIVGKTISCTDLITSGPRVDIRSTGASVDKTDNRSAILAADTKALAEGKPIYVPSGTFKIASTTRIASEIIGDAPLKSVIYNTGTGDGLDLGGASYYNRYANFQVKGNASSRDGITLYTTAGDNPGYMRFTNVYSTYNGRHGVYHRRAWGTQYEGCNFHYNEGLGFLALAQSGDGGGANALSLIQCQIRWNGGTSAATTYADMKGGISLNGGNCVTLDSCTIESNNAWQVLTGQDTYQGLNVLNIVNTYLESRDGTGATVGGTFYFNKGTKVQIDGCEIGFVASGAGQTSYAYFIDTSANMGTITERNNQYSGGGAGTELLINTGKTLKRPIVPVVTVQMGDVGAGGVPVTQTILTASSDGAWKVSGLIYCGRDSELGGVFPFIASYNTTTGKTVSVGASIVGTATTAPTMAFSTNNLQITWGANHIGHVEFSYTQTGTLPTTFTLNSTYLQRNDELASLPF